MTEFNEEQKKAIEWNEGPLLVLGTPGSGKTTVIINRIRHLIEVDKVEPSGILVITFTRAAAISMQERFNALCKDQPVRFGTFHSFFYWIIRTAYRNRDIRVLDESAKREIIQGCLRKINSEEYDNDEVVSSAINQLGRVTADMLDLKYYYSTDMSAEDFRRLAQMYAEEKLTRGVLDFDDMLSECYKLLSERRDILEQLRRLYPYIMVDEFQDTNKLQYEILKMLIGDKENIFVVGDDDQSIYSFRGARPDIMMSFKKDYKRTEVVTLSLNYRCPSIVTQFSGKLINHNKNRFSKKLLSASGTAGSVVFDKPQNAMKECALVAERIRTAASTGTELNQIAVLYRTNMNPRRLIYKLREYNIDFSARDTIPDLFSGYAVAPVINYIRFALGDNSRELFMTFMNKPVRFISRNMLKTKRVGLKELLEEAGDRDYLRKNINRLANELRTIERLNPYGAVSYIRKAMGYDNYLKEYAANRNLDYDEIMDRMEELSSIAKDCETFADLFDYINDYRKILEESKRDSSDEHGVQLMTMHSAKGLEFKEVHIIECVEGNVPHKKSKTSAELEEERRMFYVAVTRTCDRLYLYSPSYIGEKVTVESRYIEEMGIEG